jgi:hypothetical protein
MYKSLKTLHPGGIRTRIVCSVGGRDDHCATPPGQYMYFLRTLCFLCTYIQERPDHRVKHFLMLIGGFRHAGENNDGDNAGEA